MPSLESRIATPVLAESLPQAWTYRPPPGLPPDTALSPPGNPAPNRGNWQVDPASDIYTTRFFPDKHTFVRSLPTIPSLITNAAGQAAAAASSAASAASTANATATTAAKQANGVSLALTNKSASVISSPANAGKGLALVVDDPAGVWVRVANVNSSNQITAASHAPSSVNMRGPVTTFANAPLGTSGAIVASLTMPGGTATGDLCYFGINLTDISTSYANNYFAYIQVSYAGAAGSTVLSVDYLFGEAFGSLVLQASASSATSATLYVSLQGGPANSGSTVSGQFFVGNQQQR